jgi:hypothetical protein
VSLNFVLSPTKLRAIHNKGTLGFIERLRTAPEVTFKRITLKAESQQTAPEG